MKQSSFPHHKGFEDQQDQQENKLITNVVVVIHTFTLGHITKITSNLLDPTSQKVLKLHLET